VVATPDPVLGEATCACVVADGEPPGLDELRSFLNQTLARHKLPDRLCLVDAIPRSPLGKVDRVALRALVTADGIPRQKVRRG
jgi:2,3-dihydroxybenzoate-AMP ligase